MGELLALRDENVDLEAGVIRVERSWDPREGVIEPMERLEVAIEHERIAWRDAGETCIIC